MIPDTVSRSNLYTAWDRPQGLVSYTSYTQRVTSRYRESDVVLDACES